jgi:poly-gamma-glutamate capsule biosynthesis protein CapA/YwtB (metallophosphatase superfamily)
MKIPLLGRSYKSPAVSGGTSVIGRIVAAVAIVVAAAVVVAVIASASLPEAAQGARRLSAPAGGRTAGTPATRLISPTPSAAAATSAPSLAPLVPVVGFWSTQRNIALADVARLWAGLADAVAETHYQSVAIAAQDADPLARAFRIQPAGNVRIMSSAEVKAAVRAAPTTLGLLPAEDVTPDVRALAVDGLSLFGSDRTRDLTKWPLVVPAATPTTFSLGTEWTLAAGGDVNLDRFVYLKAVTDGYGPDFPWSAGYAGVDGYQCCGWQDAPLVVAADIGPAGALRKRLADADLALVNLEGSAPSDYVYRGLNSLDFTFDPALLVGLRDVGIDFVALANNHIRNGGGQGVLDTCHSLEAIGIAHAGAGPDTTAARQPAWLNAGDLRVAILSYSAVGGDNWATDTSPGAASLRPDEVPADIRAARVAGADIVIVMPHWGEEYSYALSREQEDEASAFVAAGADLILGSHSHWVGAIQSIDRPQGPAFVDYSLGDLLFSLDHDVQSQEGVIATMTFSGTRLVQVGLEPTVMIDAAQVGLLDPAGDGSTVLDAIHAASRGLLDW